MLERVAELCSRAGRLSPWRHAACALAIACTIPLPVRAADIIVTFWGVGMPGIPYAVAREKGYFQEAGVDVTGFIGGSGGGGVLRSVIANQPPAGIPYGEVAASAYLAAVRAGMPVVAVNTGATAVDNRWVAPADSRITGLKDLIGKRIGYTNAKSVSEMLLLMSLKKQGIDVATTTLVAAGGVSQGLALLDNGGLDAANIIEPLASIRKTKYKTVFTARDILDTVPLASFGVTTREYAEKHPEKIRAIIQARRRAVEFIQANPGEAARIAARAYQRLPESVATDAITDLAKAGYWGTGEFRRVVLQTLVDGLKLVGELTEDVDWSTAIDTSFLPDDLKAKGDMTARSHR